MTTYTPRGLLYHGTAHNEVREPLYPRHAEPIPELDRYRATITEALKLFAEAKTAPQLEKDLLLSVAEAQLKNLIK